MSGLLRRGDNRVCVSAHLVLLALAGCSARPTDATSLTIISPHRDEIRLESAQAFSDWFQKRTQEQAAAALSVLNDSREQNPHERDLAVARAVNRLLADWREDECVSLRETYHAWRATGARGATVEALANALKQWRDQPHPVEVVWQDVGGGTSQIVRYVRSRFQQNPEGIGIDLLFGGGTDIFLRLADEGLLEKVELPEAILGRIRPQLNGVPLYDPGRRWFGPVLSSFGILSNREVLERIGRPVPRSWADLGRPEMQGWVSAGDPRMTGAIHMVYEIILQGPLGWDNGFRLLMRAGANTHTFIRDSGTLTRTVLSGEVAAAGTLDVQALPAVGRYPRMMTFELPPGATIINPDAVAVLKGAPQRGLARAFVEFLLSDAGQLMFFLQPGQPGGPRHYPLCRLSVVDKLYAEYPPEVRSTGTTNPFAIRDTIVYNSRLGIRRWDALNDLFGAWIIDAHPDLRAAWQALLASKNPEPERQRLEGELFQPPCTQEELLAYARAVGEGSPRTRAEQITHWGEQARQRYRRIRQEAASP
jgi:ABC-type Fe3+ transport system substrate-binding protein